MRRICGVGNGVTDPLKHAPSPYVLPRRIWLPHPCGGGVADPEKYAPPHMCYPAQFGRSRSNGMSVIKAYLDLDLVLLSRTGQLGGEISPPVSIVGSSPCTMPS